MNPWYWELFLIILLKAFCNLPSTTSAYILVSILIGMFITDPVDS
jgi:hypothetical protein